MTTASGSTVCPKSAAAAAAVSIQTKIILLRYRYFYIPADACCWDGGLLKFLVTVTVTVMGT